MTVEYNDTSKPSKDDKLQHSVLETIQSGQRCLSIFFDDNGDDHHFEFGENATREEIYEGLINLASRLFVPSS